MLLENQLLKLRAPEPEDLENLYRWENLTEYWVTGNTRQPYSKFALKNYISDSSKDIYSTGEMRLMMVDVNSGITVGTVDLFNFDIHHSKIALGLFVSPEYQGKGFAGSALELVEQYIFEFLKINQLYCEIATGNTASMNLFRKKKYHENCLLNWIKTPDGFQDIAVFQLFNEDYQIRKLS
jgi:diamine N-acetyltransferase